MSPAQLSDRLSALARQLPRKIQADLTVAALTAEAEAKKNATTTLHVRSGRLRNSIRGLVVPAEKGTFELRLSAGSKADRDPGGPADVVYARIHELGGRVVPVRKQWLAIPLPPARTPAGVARYATARDAPGLRFLKSKRGNLLLVAKDGTPWYVLRKQVDIPARPYLYPALVDAGQRLAARLERSLQEAAEGFGGAQ